MGCFNSKQVDKDGNIQPKNSIFTRYEHKGVSSWNTYIFISVFYCVLYFVTGGSCEYTAQNIDQVRSRLDYFVKKKRKQSIKYIEERQIGDKVKITNIDLEVEDKVFIKVIVYTPVGLPPQGNSACVFAHGGWAILNDAEQSCGEKMIEWAHDFQFIGFNVDFRNAPEAKAPGASNDVVKVIQHVYQNAEKYGVDPKKIAAMGASGGSYVTLGAARILATLNECHKVKLVVLICPMFSNEAARVPANERWFFEKNFVSYTTSAFKLLATDYERQHKDNDPVLYPSFMSDELLAKLPPVVITTSEFDFIRRDAKTFSKRLQKAGKLLDLHDMAGGHHGYEVDQKSVEGMVFKEELMKMWKKHVES